MLFFPEMKAQCSLTQFSSRKIFSHLFRYKPSAFFRGDRDFDFEGDFFGLRGIAFDGPATFSRATPVAATFITEPADWKPTESPNRSGFAMATDTSAVSSHPFFRRLRLSRGYSPGLTSRLDLGTVCGFVRGAEP